MVENTVGKGEIARYEQFLIFPQCFQKAFSRGGGGGGGGGGVCQNVSLFGNGIDKANTVMKFVKYLSLCQTVR